jgi:hypothetical protein
MEFRLKLVSNVTVLSTEYISSTLYVRQCRSDRRDGRVSRDTPSLLGWSR